MTYGFGRRMGFRSGAGFGFWGSSPPWPYVGRGRGGLPRCRYPGAATSLYYTRTSPYLSRMSHEEELDFLKGQAADLKRELNRIETRINNLES